MKRTRMPLPANCARCPATRLVFCAQADRCARGTEPHSKGREVKDFSTEPRMFRVDCAWFLPIQYVGDKLAEPKVHDAPKGLL